ncbi:hypothetical protein KGY14_05235 [Ameyamaea chiangmaiensis]|uniref:Uncharacterized protein n=1 Tax=Ameyamaea chiangmaiensis TaxID=442969 RepID=A0A850P5Z0_9PROT|nr:hypothetical protein [Ameyamaea chiangmaiensis]MBS4074592.1 hypothetical protein [Ameyamaea chiangmaiensis]NVN39348.1 hypothetical protein [Ameyamaea chiangmaiensis]
MSETLETPAVVATDAPADRYAGVEFGSTTPETAGETPPAPADETKPEPQAEAPKEPDEPKWYVKRIGSITAKYKAEAEQRAALEQELEQYRRTLATQRGETQPEPELTPDQIRQQERDKLAAESAERQRAQAFGETTKRVADSLAAAHGSAAVTAATQSLVSRAGMDFANPTHRQVIEDISELQNAGAVYYALANDPDAASELFEAPERKQFAMLHKFAASIEEKAPAPVVADPAPKTQQISRAPAPVAAASGSGRAVSSRSIYDSDLSPEEYIKLRSKK